MQTISKTDTQIQDGTQFLGTVPRQIAVTMNGRTALVTLTAEETALVLEARREADEEIAAQILGARTSARRAA